MEPAGGIEPSSAGYKTAALPMSYAGWWRIGWWTGPGVQAILVSGVDLRSWLQLEQDGASLGFQRRQAGHWARLWTTAFRFFLGSCPCLFNSVSRSVLSSTWSRNRGGKSQWAGRPEAGWRSSKYS